VCRRLVERLPCGGAAFISCDEEVRSLFAEPAVLGEVAALGRHFGRELVSGTGIDRSALRELLFENFDFRASLEGVLHPLVLERVTARSGAWSDLVRISVIEVPLLYEVGFPLDRDIDLVVACSRSTQLARLCRDRDLEKAMAEKILRAQRPIEEKIQKANIVVWNDGAIETLYAQVDHLVSRCERFFT
jgi:dephospho-CoA kinase